MYYKIENTECEVYQKLHAMRTDELRMEEENKKAITERAGLNWETYLGHTGQQNFRRVTSYDGFEFLEPEKVDLKIWQRDKEHNSIFVPNRRTKAGREMQEFLSNGLQGNYWGAVYDILKMQHPRRFVFPYVEIAGDKIILFLDDKTEPTDKNIIEITKREFNELLQS